VVKAETIITDGKIYSDTTWTKENSPYILDDYINIYSGARLTVEPGVQIVAGTSTEDEGKDYMKNEQFHNKPFKLESMDTI
jgi:hypothetical protein